MIWASRTGRWTKGSPCQQNRAYDFEKRHESVPNILLTLTLPAVLFYPPAIAQDGTGDVVYVPTDQVVVEELLRMANVGPKDYVIDLGSGDGRIVITAAKKFGARGLGVELDAFLLRRARENAKTEGVAERAQFIEQNLFETDLRKATVITLYLLPEINLKLRPKILSLKPGTRVVAHDYHMDDWVPDEEREIKVPEKKVGTPGISYIYLWIIPEIANGKWHTKLNVAGQETACEIVLAQHFQMLDGTLRVGSDITLVQGRVKHDHVMFITEPKSNPGGQRHEFSGRISGGTITGTVRIGEGEAAQQLEWNARR